ncbi:MAG TPA: Rrf2 family transcriptional regulator [Polyangiaceae bacterium]|jgi:Rrf2 family transcriptional regulator, nitric oxide-sensitive transcriptional repressor|nr:Rrf2 family transcriptional regulator [Polyangiaceae bacterium]
MQLTQFSDYSLRVLLYLTARPERWVPLPEISRAYGVSHNHMAKVAQLLLERGYVESLRGRSGGLRLAKPPSQINVGSVVRATEPHFDLVECFDAKTNTCPIDPVCGLKGALVSAQKAFLQELDRFTLADFLPRAPALVKLWNKNLL